MLHGTNRALVNNMVKGVNEGFKKSLEVVGVGYRVQAQGDTVKLDLGFSSPVDFKIPKGIKAVVDKNLITLEGADRELLGRVAREIRDVRPTEPYQGKGIKYQGEHVRRKAGKAQAGAKGA